MSHQVVNPFSGSTSRAISVQASSDQERAIQEVQAGLVIAKRFPRDPEQAMEAILKECMRPALAESAEYAFPRGGTTVTGPSIRLAESIARGWGNIDYGMRELVQENGASQVEAYAWDMQTNTKVRRVFTVRHERHTRKGVQNLTDPRDIYELVANQGIRRVRACILELIPGDVVDAALSQVQQTLHATADVTPEAIKKLVETFSKLGIEQDTIGKRYGKKLEAILPAEIIDLRRIYASLRDGMSNPADWFDIKDQNNRLKEDQAMAAEEAIEK